jgi:tetratricopeptide (TPR) repeat protein
MIEGIDMYVTPLRAFVFALLMLPLTLLAETNAKTVSDLQHDWANANYELTGDKQDAAFEALIERADAAVASNPDSAELLIWNGIIKSSYAGVKGGLGALGLAKDARNSLEKALKLDDKALDGSAYTSLGTLYSNVPGWPVGFGNDKKAVQLLEKALEINPDGIDSNYFYADYLLQHKEFDKAEKYLLKAQSAPPRPDRPVADAGRQEEIHAALSLARGKMQHSGS